MVRYIIFELMVGTGQTDRQTGCNMQCGPQGER